MDPGEAHKTLGVWLAVDGNSKKEVDYLKGKVNKWVMMTSASVLLDKSKKLSYLTVLLPAIKYAAPVVTLSLKDCKAIMKKASPIFLNANGLSRKTNFNIAHGPLCYAGLNCFDLHAFSTASATKWIIQNIGMNNTTEKLFNINVCQHQLEMGSERNIFELEVRQWKDTCTET